MTSPGSSRGSAYRPGARTVVIVPTYNERENLAPLVGAVRRAIRCDVLVVDDNSPDGTGPLADELRKRHPQLSVLHREKKEGLGRAYHAAFRWALARGFERIVHLDCDFSHAPADIPRLVRAADEADLVVGSRYVAGGSTEGSPWTRRLLSRGANLYGSLWLGRAVKDWTSGFRCYRSSLLEGMNLDGVTARGYAWLVEMTWCVLRAGARVREIPIHFLDRHEGRSKLGPDVFFEAVRKVPSLRAGR